MRDLGFVTYSQAKKLDQAPYKFRDGIIKPTKVNPASSVYAETAKVGLKPSHEVKEKRVNGKLTEDSEPYENTRIFQVSCTQVEPINKNTVLCFSIGVEPGWHPDPNWDNVNRPTLLINDGRKTGLVQVHFDKFIVYKRPDHRWDITSERYNDGVIVRVRK